MTRRQLFEDSKRIQENYIKAAGDRMSEDTIRWIRIHQDIEEKDIRREEEREMMEKDAEIARLKAEIARLEAEARTNYVLTFKSEVKTE